MTSNSNSMICEHNSLIRRQFMKIESLETELALVRQERDGLLGENDRLHFQLQCLTQLDEKYCENKRARDVDIRCLESMTSPNFDKTSSSRQSIGNSSQSTIGQTLSPQIDYELSQQLIDRRVDALERKYGGLVARESATTIQRAFRTYRLEKRFKTIAIQALRHEKNNRIECQSTRSDDSNNIQNNETFIESNMTSTECDRKRCYRVGLNLFNKVPSERGIQYLIKNGFIESNETQFIAKFLLTRKGLSKAMIGEYISTNHNTNQSILKSFSKQIDLTSLPIDCALRKFQTFFRFPGEAQKIERLVDCFATRYIECNANETLSRDSVFILSFAIIMLNTDLHTRTNARNRMTSQQWLNNLENVFSEGNLSQQFLIDIYNRIKAQELRTGADHVTQVVKVQSAIIGSKSGSIVPNLCCESRRLVCYIRLYEIRDQNKKESKDRHQREVFLFNDLLLITKLSARAKSSHQMPEYVFRQTIDLDGICCQVFSNQFHKYGISLKKKIDQKVVILLNARNDLDRNRFLEDLKESILEVKQMETIRIQKSNSLLDLNNDSINCQTIQTNNNVINRRKTSSGSLDSGLSLPSRDHSPQTSAAQTQPSGDQIIIQS